MKKANLVGQHFGKLEVVEYAGTHRGNSIWKCKCECGNETVVPTNNLTSGNTKSCGKCVKKNKYEDLTGQTFGYWKVLGLHEDKGYTRMWMCHCTACDKVDRPVSAKNLKSGASQSCGCTHSNKDIIKKNVKDRLIGQKFNHLTVIDYAGKGKWKCECDCKETDKNIVYVSSERLKSGHTTSCGCVSKKKASEHCKEFLKDIKGQTFGDITVLEYYGDGLWKCECKCGNIMYVSGTRLRGGYVQSCRDCFNARLCELNIKKRNYPQWFIDELANEEDKERAKNCTLTTKEKVLFKCDKHGVYEQTVSAHINMSTQTKREGCPKCGNMVGLYGSRGENDVKDYIASLGYKVDKGRKVLDGKEIDILSTDKNIGIEYNGSVVHATLGSLYDDKPIDYHQQKFLLAKEKGIHLINIFDVDWNTNQERIKMYLKSLFVPQEKLMARKCEIKTVSNDTACEFVDKYHLQGANKATMKINYGLYYNDELYAVMSFGKLRLKNTKEGQYELHRYCVKDGYTIVGGAQKLLCAFEEEYSPKYILSYSDNDYFTGNIYKVLGFDEKGQTTPRYYWYINGKEIKREQCQLKKLKVQYPQLMEEAVQNGVSNKEDYVMLQLGACKVFRSGNTKWEKYY